MTRLTNQSDVNTRVGESRGVDAGTVGRDLQGRGHHPAAEKEVFGRQANKGILAERVAQELNVPRRTAARVLDAVLDSVTDLLASRGKVAVKGFGTFERKIRKGRAYKHPLTGKSIDVADKETIMFKPSDQLASLTKTGSAARPQKPVRHTPADDILFKG